MNNRDIVKFAMIKNMPGILDESARLHVGVKTGDAGVINEALQAAYDPSAGQQALQAGEPVQQPSLAFDNQAVVSALSTAVKSAMVSSICPYFDKQEADKTFLYDTVQKFVVHTDKVLEIVATRIVENKAETDAKIAENKAEADAKIAEADAKIAENKAEVDAKIAENKAEAAANFAELKDVVDVVVAKLAAVAQGASAASSAPAAPAASAAPAAGVARVASAAKVAVRKYQRYTAAAKQKVLQWLLKHSSDPYTTPEQLELLRQQTGIDTTKRMSTLLFQIRSKEMEKDKNGKWRKRVMPKPVSVLGNKRDVHRNKRAWIQKHIKDWM